MEKVLISLPIYKREWILPAWLQCIENQNYPMDHIGFMFELGPDDDGTHEMLLSWHDNHPEVFMFDGEIEMTRHHFHHNEGERSWKPSQFETMAVFRNALLDRATKRQDEFDFYFSLDSDLLLIDPNTILKLVETSTQNKLDVVSPLCFMTPTSRNYPNAMYWINGPGGPAKHFNKFKENTLQEVDIVMAAVFMSKHVVTQSRYLVHNQGEDLGFATDLARNGFKSHLDSRIYVSHMLHKSMLDNYLKTGVDKRHLVEMTHMQVL